LLLAGKGDALRGAICSGEIAPGAPLKQDEIAAEFSVSHTPVREALTAGQSIV
jgi:DNA-binding GntR family transcriptional regulator